MDILRSSSTEREAASKLGVSQQAVADAKRRAEHKGYWETRCEACQGYGVVPSDGCCRRGGHVHVCDTCKGSGAKS